MRTPGLAAVALLASALSAGGCGSVTAPAGSPPIVQPGAPGQPARTVATAEATATPTFTDTDVRFMQGMIHHHAQALDMTALLETHTTSDDMRKLGQRIAISQADEIKMMQKWLEARGQDAPTFDKATAGEPSEHAHHMAGAPMMPGMLTPDQMNQLGAAKGPAFDRLFLQFMIQHHQGALTMVKDLFAAPGAAQESDTFAFASDVDADQRAEISRMTAMLKELHQ
jgi:uncharacterized protein (DUF305 family)